MRRVDLAKLRGRGRTRSMISVAAHSPAAMRGAFFADTILFSPIFATDSARTRGTFWGLMRAARIACRFHSRKTTGTTLIGLGGIGDATSQRVLKAGFDGVGAISGLVSDFVRRPRL